MPQVSNLSWMWSISIFLFLYMSMNLLFFFNNIPFVKKNLFLLEDKFTFFFLI